MQRNEVIIIELILNIPQFLLLKSKYKLTMKEMSEKLGISRVQLWRILNNQSNPGEQFIAGFKKAFPTEEFNDFFLLSVLQVSDTQSDQ